MYAFVQLGKELVEVRKDLFSGSLSNRLVFFLAGRNRPLLDDVPWITERCEECVCCMDWKPQKGYFLHKFQHEDYYAQQC